MSNQTIGEITERLIRIKDSFKSSMSSEEIEAINDCCNILNHNFNRFATIQDLITEHITSIHWRYDDIMSALADKDYEPNKDNVDTIIYYPGLEKYLQEKGTEAGWEVIYNVISELKDKLLVLQSEEKE